MVLRIYGPKRKGVDGGWRRLHNEELHELYTSLNIIRVIKSRRKRWEVYVARIQIFWSRNVKGRGYSEDIGVDGNVILEKILRKQDG
jgi:hypothetical protein